jgi:hypothetical protein
MVIGPDNGDEKVADCVAQPCGPEQEQRLKVGSSGGRSSKTNTVIRTANTPSENALSRSGVALARNTVASMIHQAFVSRSQSRALMAQFRN